MELTLTMNAEEKLKQRICCEDGLTLALIDGKDPVFSGNLASAKGSYFQIIPGKPKFDSYRIKIDHSLFDIYTSQKECRFLGMNPQLEYNDVLNSFLLRNELTVLDYNIKLKETFFS
ncbi:hypothetical protein D920_00670 [Enterococcus faecalis 13-SD-W-01]|nr:hypothetical protein D920_00670 [Enterococcus faecalis 13-SD-W-01]